MNNHAWLLLGLFMTILLLLVRPLGIYISRVMMMERRRTLVSGFEDAVCKVCGVQRDEDMGYITKGTWGDISINLPLNPYIGLHAKHHPTVIELSWENTNHHPGACHMLPAQFQRMARLATHEPAKSSDRRGSGFAGPLAVPAARTLPARSA